MFKLWATIRKDFLLLIRDRVGLLLMFVMPIVLVVVITTIQSSTFELVNENKVPLLLCNKDTSELGQEYINALEQIGMFDTKIVSSHLSSEQLVEEMDKQNALVAVMIPTTFSEGIKQKSSQISMKALSQFGVSSDTNQTSIMDTLKPVVLLYNPVLQNSFRQSLSAALSSAVQIVERKEMVHRLYFSLNEKEIPEELELHILQNKVPIEEYAAAKDGSKFIPNATQHNIPAWTIFAMFFIVISLGASIVREKLSGSFIRLKTLPTSYTVSITSKQITYLLVTLFQVLVIFSIGKWMFPWINLPVLNIPKDIIGLIIVSILCGWCAISYAICVGIYAETQEQANGFGAVSIVILAAISGIMVPSFAMPHSFAVIMKLSPLYWCLESYYGLFLERGNLSDVLYSILPIALFIGVFQLLIIIGLKKKHLI